MKSCQGLKKERRKVMFRIVDFWDKVAVFCSIVGVCAIGIMCQACWGIALWGNVLFGILAVLICICVTGLIITKIQLAYIRGKQDGLKVRSEKWIG